MVKKLSYFYASICCVGAELLRGFAGMTEMWYYFVVICAQAIVLQPIVFLIRRLKMKTETKEQKFKRRILERNKETVRNVATLVPIFIILGAPQFPIIRLEVMGISALIGLVDFFLYTCLLLATIYDSRDNMLLWRYRTTLTSSDLAIAIIDGLTLAAVTLFLAQYFRGRYLQFYLVWFFCLGHEMRHMKKIGESIAIRDALDLKTSSEEALLNKIAERNARKDWKEFTSSIKEALNKSGGMLISLAHCPVPCDGQLCLKFELKRELAGYWRLDKKSFDTILSILSIIPPDDLVFFCIEYSGEDTIRSGEDPARPGEDTACSSEDLVSSEKDSVFCRTYGCDKEEYFIQVVQSM